MLTLFVWPQTAAPGNEYGTGTWFNWAKTYSALAAWLHGPALREVVGRGWRDAPSASRRDGLCFPGRSSLFQHRRSGDQGFAYTDSVFGKAGLVENLWTISTVGTS